MTFPLQYALKSRTVGYVACGNLAAAIPTATFQPGEMHHILMFKFKLMWWNRRWMEQRRIATVHTTMTAAERGRGGGRRGHSVPENGACSTGAAVRSTPCSATQRASILIRRAPDVAADWLTPPTNPPNHVCRTCSGRFLSPLTDLSDARFRVSI